MPPHAPTASVAPLLLRREAQGCFFAPPLAMARASRVCAPLGEASWFPCVAVSAGDVPSS